MQWAMRKRTSNGPQGFITQIVSENTGVPETNFSQKILVTKQNVTAHIL